MTSEKRFMRQAKQKPISASVPNGPAKEHRLLILCRQPNWWQSSLKNLNKLFEA
jgi:hypothetical protein